MTLNILRPFRINLNMSAHTEIEGQFDFNKTPLAPPGINLIGHEKLQQRNNWGIYGLPGWYNGPDMEHY